jgi:phage terminase large subunit-like protein
MLIRAETKGDVLVVNGHMNDNTALSSTYLDDMRDKFAGSRLEAQELAGKMLEADLDGVLWHLKDIHNSRDASERMPAGAQLRVVGVDPTNSDTPRDECGIVVVGATKHRDAHKRHAYVLEDASLKASPEVWAQTVVDTYKKWNAGAVVVEMTGAQHLLKMAIKAIDPSIRVIGVNSSQGKKLRATPVAQKYEQRKVHHWTGASLFTLEDQMTQWEPAISKYSPDRVDALVHAITALLIDPPPNLFTGPMTVSKTRNRRAPSGGRGTGRTWRNGTSK